MNNHASKLLEDCLEAAYREYVRMLLSKVFEQYMVGAAEDDCIRRMNVGLQRLHEAHVILAREIKNNG